MGRGIENCEDRLVFSDLCLVRKMKKGEIENLFTWLRRKMRR